MSVDPIGRSRRRISRLHGRFSVEYDFHGTRVKGVVTNFSETGLFVDTRFVLDAGTVVTFARKFGQEEEVALQGKVMWARKIPAEDPSSPPRGMGVGIIRPPIRYLSFVKEFREQLAKTEGSRDKRFDVMHRVQFYSGSHFISEYCENLSRGGMYMATDEPMESGKVVKAMLEIPGFEKAIEVQGRVAYRLDAKQAEEIGRAPGIGLQFVDLSPEDTSMLSHYLKRIEIHRHTPERRRIENLPSSGSLSDYLVPEILLGLLEQKATGTLELQGRGIKKLVFVRKGEPVFVRSTIRAETLGYHLVRQGALSEEDLEISLAEYAKHDLHHGEIMMRGGMIDAPTLAKYLVTHQEEKLSNTFPWFDGSYDFIPGTNWPESMSFFPLRPYAIVYSGVKRWYDAAVIKAWMGLDEHSTVRLVRIPSSIESVPLELLQLLRKLDGPKDIKQLARDLKLQVEDVLPMVFSLVISRCVEFHHEEEEVVETVAPPEKKAKNPKALAEITDRVERDYEKIRYLNFFEIFNLPLEATEKVLADRFYEMIEPYSEENILQIEDPKLHEKASQVLSWLRVGYYTLRDPQMRQLYSKRGRVKRKIEDRMAQFDADRLFLAAMRDLGKEEYEKAAERLKRGLEKYPEDPTFSGYLGWALFQLNPRDNILDAGQLLDKAIQRDPADAQTAYFRGQVHTYQDEWRKAEECFSRALRLQPNFTKAHMALDDARANRLAAEKLAKQRSSS